MLMPDQEKQPYQSLLTGKVKVVNVGLEGFVKDLRDCDIDVVHLDWAPSAGGDPQMAALLANLGV
jgi:FdrA protein